jgi:hypothetical protein
MHEHLENNEISLIQWSVMFECDHQSEVRAKGQKVANISNMTNKDLREVEITKTVVRCVDCHRVKTNVFGEHSKIKPLVSEKTSRDSKNAVIAKTKKNCLLC